jgi:hypothetical protein
VPEDILGREAPDHQTLDELALLPVYQQRGLALVADGAR